LLLQNQPNYYIINVYAKSSKMRFKAVFL